MFTPQGVTKLDKASAGKESSTQARFHGGSPPQFPIRQKKVTNERLSPLAKVHDHPRKPTRYKSVLRTCAFASQIKSERGLLSKGPHGRHSPRPPVRPAASPSRFSGRASCAPTAKGEPA